MKRYTAVLLGAWMIGCMQDEPEIGSDFFNEVSFEILSWDTLTMDMYTVHFDSIQTNNPARLLVGTAKNEVLDVIQSEAFFQLGSTLEYNAEDLAKSEFQQAFLTLYYDDYFYGDTTVLMDLVVYEVAEDIELNDDLVLYNLSSFEVKKTDSGLPISLGRHSFNPRPITRDSVDIPLDETFTRSLFDYLKSEQITTHDFLDSLRGLKVLASTEGAIIGFKTDFSLKLEYRDYAESILVDRTLVINSIGESDIQFNHIDSDGLEDLFVAKGVDQVPSEETENKTYIQSGLGLAIRIELPYLQGLLSTDHTLLIDEVQLELTIENSIPEEVYMLNSNVTLSKVDGENQTLIEYDVLPELVLDIEYREDQKFVIDITDFVEEQLSIYTPENEEALLIRFPSEYFFGSVNHLVVSDQQKSIESSKIILNVLNIK